MQRIAGLCLLLALGAGFPDIGLSEGKNTQELPPYKLVRTLQSIQDKVIAGDLDAVEMQRFMLEEVDKRLKTADASVFEDTRNVDAALIYAMSGGNPQTLDLLAERDVAGNFDNRVTSVLRRYLSGKGGTTWKQLKEIVPEYRYTKIGPYLELIGANALAEKDEATALKYFDWARVESPGSIIEEAALRRSLNLTSKKGDTAKALPYARRYARRFMGSPYASQFADIFVGLAIDHKDALPPTEITAVLSLVERKRQREIFLRLARRAAINGDRELANFASESARRLSSKEDTSQLALADLYSGIVEIPSDGIEDVLTRLAAIPDHELSPKDRFLKNAAEIVAEDEKEAGRRALLNLGHTFGHAIEAEMGFGDALKHGEAVGVGMAQAFRFSAAQGLCSGQDAARAEAAIKAAGLPTTLSDVRPEPFNADALIAHCGQDKKAEGGKLTFVLARGIGDAFVAKDVDRAALKAFLLSEGAI